MNPRTAAVAFPEADAEPVTPLSRETIADFDAIAARYPAEMRPSLVLPLLYRLQAERGHLGAADARAVAAYLGLPAMSVVEALSWYTMLAKEPTGRHVIKVCRNIACALRGAESLVDHLQARLGIGVGETTADGRYTLQTVECLASCGTAPAMQVGDTYFENLDAARVDAILRELP